MLQFNDFYMKAFERFKALRVSTFECNTTSPQAPNKSLTATKNAQNEMYRSHNGLCHKLENFISKINS